MIKLLSYIVWSLSLCLLVLFLSNTANASAPITKFLMPGDFGTQTFDSLDALCEVFVKKRLAASSATTASCRPPHSGTSIRWFISNRGELTDYATPVSQCSDGTEPNTSLALANQCPDSPQPETCLPETTTGSVTWKMWKGTTNIYNPWADKPGAKNGMGCKVEVIEVEDCYTLPKSADPDIGYCTFKTRQSGGMAENGVPDPNRGGDVTDAQKARDSLPPTEGKSDGACPRGTVNAGLSASGIPMCIGNGTKPSNSPAAPPKVEVEKNETLPDGSTQNTKSVTTKNADGSTTTVKTVTVTKPTGEKETTQDKNTTATPGGKPGKETENPVTEQNNVCKQNPNLAMCKNSTVGGKCGETSCTGDAIQCATLRATAILQCKAEKDEADLKASPLAAKGQSAIDGKDMEGLPGPKNGLVVNVNSMKSEGWLGNGAAFEDVSVSIRGQEILIPLSKWSSYLLPFRYMLMIIASLISYRIIAGSVLKE